MHREKANVPNKMASVPTPLEMCSCSNSLNTLTNGWMDGLIDGGTDGWMGGQEKVEKKEKIHLEQKKTTVFSLVTLCVCRC